MLGFKILLFSFIGVGFVVFFAVRYQTGQANWRYLFFPLSLTIISVVVRLLLKEQAPWTRRMEIWLALMVGGLFLAVVSLWVKGRITRRNWKRLRAKCLDQKIFEDWGKRTGFGKNLVFSARL